MATILLYSTLVMLALAAMFCVSGCSGGGPGGPGGGGGTASSKTVVFSGTVTHGGAGEAGATVSLYDARGTLLGATTSGAGGAWTYSKVFNESNTRVDIKFHKDGAGYVDSTVTRNVNPGVACPGVDGTV